jgi:hypothetical protein
MLCQGGSVDSPGATIEQERGPQEFVNESSTVCRCAKPDSLEAGHWQAKAAPAAV